MDDGAPSGRDAAACAESDSATVREDRRGRRRHAFFAGGAVTVAAVVGVVVALSGHPPRTASASAAVSAVRASQDSSAAPSLVPLSALAAANDPCLSAIATLAVLNYQLGSDFRDPSKAAADIRRTMPTIQHDMSAAPSSTLKLALADALTHLQALLADVTAGDPHAAQSSASAQVGNDGSSISSAC